MGDFPPDYCFPGPQQFADDMVALMSATLPGVYNTFNYGNTVPVPADRNKPWLRLNADGTPDRWYTWGLGKWISPHPLQPLTHYRSIYIGTEAELELFDGGEAGVPTETTGPFWCRDEYFGSDDGTWCPRVPIGLGMLTSGLAITTGARYGGAEKHTLTLAELPAAINPLLVGRQAYC